MSGEIDLKERENVGETRRLFAFWQPRRKRKVLDNKKAHHFALVPRMDGGEGMVLEHIGAGKHAGAIPAGFEEALGVQVGKEVVDEEEEIDMDHADAEDVAKAIHRTRVNQLGLPNDGYDYSKHLSPITGAGMYLGAQGEEIGVDPIVRLRRLLRAKESSSSVPTAKKEDDKEEDTKPSVSRREFIRRLRQSVTLGEHEVGGDVAAALRVAQDVVRSRKKAEEEAARETQEDEDGEYVEGVVEEEVEGYEALADDFLEQAAGKWGEDGDDDDGKKGGEEDEEDEELENDLVETGRELGVPEEAIFGVGTEKEMDESRRLASGFDYDAHIAKLMAEAEAEEGGGGMDEFDEEEFTKEEEEELGEVFAMVMRQYRDADIGLGRDEESEDAPHRGFGGSVRAGDLPPGTTVQSNLEMEMDAFLRSRGVHAEDYEDEEESGGYLGGAREGRKEQESGDEEEEEEGEEEEGDEYPGMEGLKPFVSKKERLKRQEMEDESGGKIIPVAILESEDDPVKFGYLRRAARARWDCESVLTTQEKGLHAPTVIDESAEDDAKSFLTGTVGERRRKRKARRAAGLGSSTIRSEVDDRAERDDDAASQSSSRIVEEAEEEEEEDGKEYLRPLRPPSPILVPRSRDESKEDKKKRKEAAKAYKKLQRERKRNVKQTYKQERAQIAAQDTAAAKAGAGLPGRPLFKYS